MPANKRGIAKDLIEADDIGRKAVADLSFGVPANKRGIAKDLIEADDIGRKAVADFIDSLLVKKICLSHPP